MANAGFTIPGVHLAPGLDCDAISVRELTRQGRICTWFDGDRAMLYAGHDLVGLAARSSTPQVLYELESLTVPEIIAPDASSSGKLLPVWYRYRYSPSSAHESPGLQSAEHLV